MTSWKLFLGGAYALSYGVLYFHPELIHQHHSFRSNFISQSIHKPSIAAHRGGKTYLS